MGGLAGTARALFLVGLGGWAVWFMADATAGAVCTLCYAGSIGLTIQFDADGMGPMGLFGPASTTGIVRTRWHSRTIMEMAIPYIIDIRTV